MRGIGYPCRFARLRYRNRVRKTVTTTAHRSVKFEESHVANPSVWAILMRGPINPIWRRSAMSPRFIERATYNYKMRGLLPSAFYLKHEVGHYAQFRE